MPPANLGPFSCTKMTGIRSEVHAFQRNNAHLSAK